MKNQEEFKEQEEKKGPLSGKGFAITSAICLLAIGAAAFIAYGAMNPVSINQNNNSSNTVSRPGIVSSEPLPSAPDNEPVSSEEPPSSNTESVVSKVEQSGTNSPPVASFFIMPISGGTVYKQFDSEKLQYSNTYDDYRLHAAVDITSEKSKTVTACGEGIVLSVTKEELMGNIITIDHGNGIIARYCGFADKVNVKKGDIVSSTTVLGEIGSIPAESLDAPHIHLEFTKDGKAVSPIELFN